MSAWVVLYLLGQVDGGLSPPPPPPPTIPEGVDFPRVIRTPGRVCIESLDAAGALKRDCRLDEPVAPAKPAQKEPPSRLVGSVNVLGGLLLIEALAGEFAFSADVGVRFRNGVGVVGLIHGGIAPLPRRRGSTAELVLHRYALGAGLRLGDTSHVVLGVAPSVQVLSMGTSVLGAGVTILVRASLVLARYFALLLLPTLTADAGGMIASICAGVGVAF